MNIAIFSATQRCGSTLVQRIFNLQQDTLVWGECGRFPEIFYNLLHATLHWSNASAKEREQYFKNSKPVDLFIANLSPEKQVVTQSVQSAYGKFCSEMFSKAPYTRVGFKEVNISPKAIEFFRSTFSDCTCIFLSRDPWETWRSLPRGWGVSLDQFAETWTTNTSDGMRRENFFWYEEIVAAGPGLSRLSKLALIDEANAQRALDAVVGATLVAEKNFKTEDEKSQLVASIRAKADPEILLLMRNAIDYL